MPRKYVLSWSKTHKRWHKTINGKKYYFRKSHSKADLVAYKESVDDYERLLAGQARKQRRFATPKVAEDVDETSRQYLTKNSKSQTPVKRGSYSYPSTSVAGFAERYYEYEISRARTGQITLIRLRNISREVSYFVDDFLKKQAQQPNSGVILNEQKITNYYRHLLSRLSPTVKYPRPIVVTTANRYFRKAKSFIHWCWENRLIDELPRNLNDSKLSFAKLVARHERSITSKIEIFTPEQLRELLDHCPVSNGRYKIKLYILLGLNCGFTSTDIATLRLRHIHFDESGVTPLYIERERAKTGVSGKWLLWGETRQLMERAINDKLNKDGDILFHTQLGTLLEYKRISLPVNGKRYAETKMIQSTPVNSRFNTVKKHAFKEPVKLSFKYLRKTTATMISRLDVNNADRIAERFLAHSIKSIAGKSYIQPNNDELEAALREVERIIFYS